MSHVLDNMIWHALITGNRDIAIVEDGIAYFRPDIAPFAGMQTFSQEGLQKLHALIETGKRVAIHSLEKHIDYDPSQWNLVQHMDVTQMVCERIPESFTSSQTGKVISLGEAHIPQMLELTRLTRPGPFLQRTIEFGNYVGVLEEGRLAAMAGQRMHPVPYLEISAVCTHPDFQGQGYAKACMLAVMQKIVEQERIPFLHVLTSNISAIRLYESIGYIKRTELIVDVIERV